jgi:type II secretory pathway pseudopilin PulG
MVVLLIGMAITAIWMSAALPAWRQQVQRQREEDLIFRGEQYARAIVTYQKKNNGAFPPNIDILVSQRYLRKKWKDPVTNDDFQPVGAGLQGIDNRAPSTPRGAQAPTAPSVSPGGQQPGRGTPGGGPQQLAGQNNQAPGVSGVRSKSSATSIKLYQNQQQYNLWPFDAQLLYAKMGYNPARGNQPGRGGPQTPDGRGGPARGGQPGAQPQGPGVGVPRGGPGQPPPPPPPGGGVPIRRGGGGG